nr:translation initiation factor IF-2-like [Aegilops tauschii subsp. strangulata]
MSFPAAAPPAWVRSGPTAAASTSTPTAVAGPRRRRHRTASPPHLSLAGSIEPRAPTTCVHPQRRPTPSTPSPPRPRAGLHRPRLSITGSTEPRRSPYPCNAGEGHAPPLYLGRGHRRSTALTMSCPRPVRARNRLTAVRARSPARRGLPPRRGHALAAPVPPRPRPTRAPAHRLPPWRAHRVLPLLCLAPSPPACATTAPPAFGRRRPRPAAPCSPAAPLGRGHASSVCSRALAGSSRPATRYARSAGPLYH